MRGWLGQRPSEWALPKKPVGAVWRPRVRPANARLIDVAKRNRHRRRLLHFFGIAPVNHFLGRYTRHERVPPPQPSPPRGREWEKNGPARPPSGWRGRAGSIGGLKVPDEHQPLYCATGVGWLGRAGEGRPLGRRARIFLFTLKAKLTRRGRAPVSERREWIRSSRLRRHSSRFHIRPIRRACSARSRRFP